MKGVRGEARGGEGAPHGWVFPTPAANPRLPDNWIIETATLTLYTGLITFPF